MGDTVEALLRRSPLTQAQRADLWDAYNGAQDQDGLAAALKPLRVPNEIKAGLWDMKSAPAAPESPAQPPNVGRGFGHFGAYVAPPEHENIAERMKRGAFETWKDATDFYFGPENNSAADLERDKGVFHGMATMALGAPLPGAASDAVGVAERYGGKASAWMAAHPRMAHAAMGAIPGALDRNPREALIGGVTAVVLGGGGKGAPAPAAMAEAGAAGAESAAQVVMTKAEATAQIKALQAAGKMEESRRLIEGIRSKAIRLADVAAVEAPAVQEAAAAASAPGGTNSGWIPQEPVYVPQEPVALTVPAPPGPRGPAGPIPRPGNVKPATIHQPEGTSYTMNRPEGAARAGKVSPKSAALVDDQLRAIAESGGEGNPLLTPQAQSAIQDATPAAAKVLDRGRDVAQKHDTLMSFAKRFGKENPNVKNIQVLLDESGAPSEVLTSGKAGAATKKGLRVVWVRNLWGASKNLLD